MARRKFRNGPRNEALTERSFQEYLYNLPAPQISRPELLRMIKGGEDTYFELKVKLSNTEKITQGIIALANTAGGMFVFGVSDQLRIERVEYPEDLRNELVRICREDIFPPLVPLIDMVAFDNGRRIVVLEVEGKRRPYRTREGRFFLRFGAEKREASREELSVWLDEIRPISYENIPVSGCSEQDIDDALLWSFARAFEGEIESKFSWETGEFLRKDLLLAVGNQEEITPTVAAVLLFGRNERVAGLLPRSVVLGCRYSGKEGDAQVVEKIEFKGNLSSLFEQMMKFVLRYADLGNEKSAVRRPASPVAPRASYHRDSIREALSNCLIHRDMALKDIPTRLNIYDDSIEVINPRRTNGFVPPASRAIRYGISQRLNPQIAGIFSRSEYGVEKTHGGLPMILRETLKFSGKRTEVMITSDEFRLKIHGA